MRSWQYLTQSVVTGIVVRILLRFCDVRFGACGRAASSKSEASVFSRKLVSSPERSEGISCVIHDGSLQIQISDIINKAEVA